MALTRITNVVESVDTISTNNPAANSNPSGGVGHTWLNKTSGQMYICTDATAGANVWINIGDGTGQIPNTSAATGGTVTTQGDYKIHTFTTSANFVVTTSGANAEMLLIAGGGGSGASHITSSYTTERAGGGGAGGYRHFTSIPLSNQTYSIIVGAGGTGQAAVIDDPGSGGGDSSALGYTSSGGGCSGFTGLDTNNGITGGSGGGAGSTGSGGTGGSGNKGKYTPAEGNNGGGSSTWSNAGGGGGSGGPGQPNVASGGAGPGTANSISGSSVTYAAGGAVVGQNNGGANTGDGAGGHAINADNTNIPNGGSGIVILKYKFQQSLGDIKWLYQKSQQIW